MATTVNYKGAVLTTVDNQTRTLKTAGKYMEGDVSITDTPQSIAIVSEHANSVGGVDVDISSATENPLSYTDTLDAGGGTIRNITADVVLKLQSKQATPSTVEQTITPDTGYDGLSEVVVEASKNVQIAQNVDRVAATSYTAVSGQSLTVTVTGTYDIYWSGYRSSTSDTSGSQLYIDSTAYGSAQTTFSNHGQSVHLTNVSLTAGQTIAVYAMVSDTSYFMYVANLTIVQQ